ncbi:MAG: aminomethyl-transferring glycine dehydrogenase [Chloroflexi bacterium]|nr:aminomethyl-transferring glycine dehydrogenase [Chloroflexota bacterium]
MSNHPYIPNTDKDINQMLSVIGVESFEKLISDLPKHLLFPKLNIGNGLTEPELYNHLNIISKENFNLDEYSLFLGAGSYKHYIPATVNSILQRGDFATAYTPYQPEAAQGTLQSGFEFQSLVSRLMGMEVTNAGMYDGPTAFAEACLMACRITKKNKIGLVNFFNPTIIEVLKSYIAYKEIEIIEIKEPKEKIPEDLACLCIQYPNFFGSIPNLDEFVNISKSSDCLSIVHTNPISLGFLKSPGEYGVDIVTAEGQPLGVPISYGGPYIGLFSCNQTHIRQMPGRIIGQTTDIDGKIAYTLTLQTREQHIRRERATSNICTSTQLIGLMVTIYLATLGPDGIKDVGNLCYQKSHYLANSLRNIKGVIIENKNEFFNEFVFSTPLRPSFLNEKLLQKKIIGGLDISNIINNGILICCTEMNTKQQIDSLVSSIQEILNDNE